MIDGQIRRWIDPALDLAGSVLQRIGLTANSVTIIGFGIGAVAAFCLAVELYSFALVFILLSRLCDGLDGAVARHSAQTDLGAFLDITLDFIFYSGIVFAFAIGRPDMALPAAFLIFSFIGTGASFLAYAIMAEKRGLKTQTRGKKSLFYLGGLTEGFETISVLCLICLLPNSFDVIAWTFGALCWVTTCSRILTAIQTLAPQSDAAPVRDAGTDMGESDT